jgi:hypothetical protein
MEISRLQARIAGLESEIQSVTEELLVVETIYEATQREMVALGASRPPPIPTGKGVLAPVFKTEMTVADREQVERRLRVLERHHVLAY